MISNRCYGNHSALKEKKKINISMESGFDEYDYIEQYENDLVEKQYIEIDSGICPICNSHSHVVTKSQLYWCPKCNVPLYDKECENCHSEGTEFASDCRVVFPEEKHLLEILLKFEIGSLDKISVWNTGGNKYYFNGKRKINGQKKIFKTSDLSAYSDKKIEEIQKDYAKCEEKYISQIKKMQGQEFDVISQEQRRQYGSDYKEFQEMVDRFVKANHKRFNQISTQSMEYIRNVADGFLDIEMFISFSGGKDSTVVADLVRRALSNSSVLHLYGNTTLEFPFSEEYVKEYKSEYDGLLLLSAENKDKDFYKLSKQLGPPSRVMRWCCTIFKTGAINRRIEAIFRDKVKILSFQGIRWNESTSRSKYEQTSYASKISKQKVAAPIIDWFDFDVWLYILTTNIKFNRAYRLGFTRVGCWCCPNNSVWSEFLSRIYMPDLYKKFHEMLMEFAISTGKKNPENYVNNGNWKARQGGNGLSMAENSRISVKPCVEEKDAFRYELRKPIDKNLYELFKPFGKINFDMGNKRRGEVYVLDNNNRTIFRIQGKEGTNSLRVIAENISGFGDNLEECKRKVDAQITKFQMCVACRACESVCKFGAISTRQQDGLLRYHIKNEKCVKCRECISHFTGGCYMRKVLTIKRI